MLAIKHALEPTGIMNSGIILAPFQGWEQRPLKIKLNWDHK